MTDRCQRLFFAGSIWNAEAPTILDGCTTRAHYLMAWTADALPNPSAPYRERLPRVPQEMVAAVCGKHITLTRDQQRALDRTGEWVGPDYSLYEIAA